METKKNTPQPDISAAQVNSIVRYCALLDDIKIVMHQFVTQERVRAVKAFVDELNRRNMNALKIGKPLPAPKGLYEYDLFMYGYISGIRAERQKRRAKA